MTTELEIDKDEFDEFVRETLNLAPGTALTDFQYGVVQDKIANHEVDLMSWLEKQRAAANEVKAPKFPLPGSTMNNLPPPPSSPQPPKQPAGASAPASKPASGAPTPAKLPAAPAAPSKPALPVTPPPANRNPIRTKRSRHIGPKKGGVGIVSTLLTLILVVVTAIMVVPVYTPLEMRENLAKAEWLKSLPPDFVRSVLFKGQNNESSPSLQYAAPVGVLSFTSKKPFRALGSLRLGSPVLDVVEVELEIASTSGGESYRQMLIFSEGQQEVEFDTKMPAGDYQIRLKLLSDMKVDKLPSNFDVAIRF